MKLLAITLVVLATTSAVRAQPGAETPPLAQPSAEIQPVDPAVSHQEPLVVLPPNPTREASGAEIEIKSPLVAGLLSGGVTLAGLGVLPFSDFFKGSHGGKAVYIAGFAVFAIGPSVGQIYARNTWNTGLKVRLAAAAALGAGILIAGPACGDSIRCGMGVGFALIPVCGSFFIGGSIYEIVTAPRAARRYNERAARRQLAILPIAAGPTFGLSVAGAF